MVNLKRKDVKIGVFSYDAVLPRLRAELDRIIVERATSGAPSSIDAA
jgi:hypothetical protein